MQKPDQFDQDEQNEDDFERIMRESMRFSEQEEKAR
jgi:hypothetical protein